MSAQTYTIREVSSRTRDWDGKGGSKNRSFYVKVEGDEKVYELAQRINGDKVKPPPKPGDTLEAKVTTREHEGTTYYKLERVYQQNNAGGNRGPRTEGEEKWITARFAVEEANKLVVANALPRNEATEYARAMFALVVELAP